ncbi:MAG: glycosyltransferase family 2 protein [Phycisphaeraceae bacterium]|nr:glycosyltransferase family 2 protein [Phycisphaeraceae bacterium]
MVIPAYNEAHRLPEALEKISSWARKTNRKIQLIVVDDGSTDRTRQIAADFEAPDIAVRLLENKQNRGKGYSVRRGMLSAETDAPILMTDADLSSPIEEVEKLLLKLAEGFEVVIGSRMMPESIIEPPRRPMRRLTGWGFRMLRRLFLLPEIRDTQCGFKLFTAAAAQDAFTDMKSEGWAFETEALALDKKRGRRHCEVGLRWTEDDRTPLHAGRDAPRMLMSLLKIRWRLWRHRAAAG